MSVSLPLPRRTAPLAALGLLTFLTLSNAAHATPAHPSSTHATGPVHTDVRAACPDLEASLNRSMAHTHFKENSDGVMRVDFQLEGRRISHVRMADGPWFYRQAVRRAVGALSCQAPAGPAHYAMALVFKSREADDHHDHMLTVREIDPTVAALAPR